MKSGVSLQNEFIRHFTILGRQNINFKGFLYVSFGTNELTNEDGTRGIGRNRKYGNVRRIVQKPDTCCEKILNMLIHNNNSSPLPPNLKVCQWKWQVTLIYVLQKGMQCSKCRLDMTTRLNLVKRFDATRHQKHIFSAADNLFWQFLRFP